MTRSAEPPVPSRDETARSSRARVDRSPAWATPRRAGLAVVALAICLLALSAADVWLESHTGRPVGMPMSGEADKPDLRFGYEHAELVEMFASYGQSGRRAYGVGLLVDTVYPLVLAAATILLAARAFGRRLRWLWIFPAAFAVLDVIENALLGAALLRYPDVPADLVRIVSPVTQIKLLSFPPTIMVLLLALAALAVRLLQHRMSQGPGPRENQHHG